MKRGLIMLAALVMLLTACDKRAPSTPAPPPVITPNPGPSLEPNLTTDASPSPAVPPSSSPPPAPLANLNGVYIATDGLPDLLSFADGELWKERYDEVRLMFDVNLTFNALGRRADIRGDVRRSVEAGAPLADLILVTREEMAVMAQDGTLEELTAGLLGSGLPESYYKTGWLDGKLYGFSATPVFGDGLLVYNKILLQVVGAALPGDMFDGGNWSLADFHTYCAGLLALLPRGITAFGVSKGDFLMNATGANGGYVFHPETNLLMSGGKALAQVLAAAETLEAEGILGKPAGAEDFVMGRAVIIQAGPEDIARFLALGMDIGVVPYPWGPNTRAARVQSADGAELLTGNYRVASSGGMMFALVKGALQKAEVKDYVNIVFSYLELTDELSENARREREGRQPYNHAVAALEWALAAEDYARLRWWSERTASPIPSERLAELPNIF